MPFFRSQKQTGQTLIETLITVLFIAVSAIALIRFQNYLSYTNSLDQQRADAALLAVKQIETQRDFQVLNNTAGYTSYQSIATTSSTTSGATTTYTISSTVTAYTNPTYKKIDVTVSWTDRNGNAKSLEQVSYVAGIDPSTSATIM